MQLVIEKGWSEALSSELKKPYINTLKSFVYQEAENGVVFPPLPRIFEALKFTPLEKVKVVIVGQDPYHGPNQAHGLCFSVQKGVPIPPSLRNIYKELKSDLGIAPPSHGYLESWARQGVLMLNATLTVRQGEPKSHYGKGWESLTDHIIQTVYDKEEPVVFLLWGRSAKEKIARLDRSKPRPHKILTSAHPSPLSATKFFGCRHFSQTNALLEAWGKTPIDWRIS